MKETNQKVATEQVSNKEVEQKKELKKVGVMRPHKNHTLFEFNKSTGIVRKAKFDNEHELNHVRLSEFLKPISVNKKVLIKEDCIYIPALNLKNAIKKIAKNFNVTINKK